jgi:NAD dependent epimerase/dehydratase family enzyme
VAKDADFIALPDERREKKKKRKEKKKKNRENRANASAAEGDGVVDLAEEGLSAEAKKEKVKQALEEYRQLDAGGKPVSWACL